MKRIMLVSLLLLSQALESCNRCLGYTGRKFRQQAIEHVPCDCNCEKQYHVRYDDKKGYGCIHCGHRLLPTDPFESSAIPEITVAPKVTPMVKAPTKKSHRKKTRSKQANKRLSKNS